MKFAGVSVVNVIITQAVLIFCSAGLDWSGVASNITAVTVAAGPAYILNRYWVWQKTSPNHFWREVMPFWTFAVVGLVLSTLAVAAADSIWGTTIAISIANLVGFGVIWLAKFFFLEHVLFGPEQPVGVDG